MPRKRTVKPIENPETTLSVTASNIDDGSKKGVEESSETVTIACHLPFGLRFDDVPNGKGGTKVITFPGINDDLRGHGTSGILLGKGKAVAVTLPKADWEALKAKHGRERAFIGYNGFPPCLIEMSSTKEFNARQDEVAEMEHGLEPADPASEGVAEVQAVA